MTPALCVACRNEIGCWELWTGYLLGVGCLRRALWFAGLVPVRR